MASTRLQSLAFWGVLVFILEALLFILVGQQLPSILGEIEEYSAPEVLLYAAFVYGVVVAARMAWFFTTPPSTRCSTACCATGTCEPLGRSA